MSISAFDSRIFRNLFGTDEVRQIFTDEAYAQFLVQTESALARAESTAGVIPSDVGAAVTAALDTVKLDFERLSQETEIVGYPVLPLVRQLVEHTPEERGKYIHWGATTQDIMDVASILQMKRGLQLIERELDTLIDTLTKLSKKYRDTPMAGRTHLQHALPCTFGYKCAVYLSSILRHKDRLEQLKERCLLVQFGGAAGTLASLGTGDSGLRVREQLAKELGLEDPLITWHVARDNVAEILNYLAVIGGTLGKIALDIIILSSNELDEVSEPFVPHRGASSTMPQKRNPISSEVILAASKLLRSHASLGLDAMVSDFERASGPWHLEWVAIPEAFTVAVGALYQTNFALSGLVVKPSAMKKNLLSTRGLIVGEAVMMRLAELIGRQQAHDAVYDACKSAIENDEAVLDVLKKDRNVVEQLGENELARLCDPMNYLGSCQLMVDRVVERADAYLANGK